ncbi:TIGR02147 family protein [Hallerella porci]|nr:TIGR02147 family protein [Hallerella porci]
MYFDYREYLRTVLENFQAKGFSTRAIQEFSQVSGSAFFSRILDNARPLSLENAKKLTKSWKLTAEESDYFLDLVRFGNEKNIDEREIYMKKLLAARAQNQEFALQDSKLQFFSKWYYPVLRDLLPLLPAKISAAKIGAMFTPALRAPQIQSGIQYLIQAGFVTLQKNGTYKVSQPIISTPPRVRSTILRKYHLKNLEVNAQVYDAFTSDDRSITSVTCSLSRESFEKVREEIAKLREKILAISREEKNPDRVCYVGFQLVNRAQIKEKK